MWDYDRELQEQRRREYWDWFWKQQRDSEPYRPWVRRRGDSPGRSGPRIRHPIRFHVLMGAIGWAGLGLWFAISEGDLPLAHAAATFGGIGAVLGLIVSSLVRAGRAIRELAARVWAVSEELVGLTWPENAPDAPVI